jgi:GntP family gluconate:H+ symporter
MTSGTGLAAIASGAWAEPLTLALMLACFGLLAIWWRWPIGVALLVSAWAGAAANGNLLPHRHLVEGAFSYLDPVLVIATAMIFMRALADGGALATIAGFVERRLGRRPAVLLPILMGIVMFPGMITGSSTASVLATGTLVGSMLVALGLPRERAAAIIAMGGVLGMIAPPINIPAMLIGSGIDLPYAGFAKPLAIASFPLAVGVVYWLGWPVLGKRRAPPIALASTSREFPLQPADDGDVTSRDVTSRDVTSRDVTSRDVTSRDVTSRGLRLQPEPGVLVAPARRIPVWRALVAPAAAALLMTAPRTWPLVVPDYGLPLAFLAAAAVAVAASPRFRVVDSMVGAIEDVLPVAGILVGVGAFIQVMTLTGGRGWLVAAMFGAPPWAVFGAAAAGIPAFGAVSAFGSASVLGVPFLLALLGRNEIVTASALSMLAALGDLMLPAAIAATLSAQAVGLSGRRAVLRLCIVPALGTVAVAVVMLAYAPELGRWLR